MRHGGNVWEGGDPGRWMDFSANLRPEGTPAWVMQAMREALEHARYYPDRSMMKARSGLCAYAGIQEDMLLPTAGGAAAIDLALGRKRGTVYICMPTFGEYAQRAAAYGREVKAWKGTCAAGDTLVLCNPNNPTGKAFSREDVLALYRRVSAMGGELLVDEAFIDFCPEHSVRGDVAQGLTVVGSLTKALCIPGVRLGYLCAGREARAQLEERSLPWAFNAFAAAVAARLPEHLVEMADDAKRNRARRETFCALLRDRGVDVFDSQANFILADFGKDMTSVVQRLKMEGILVRTCASFELGPRYLRLAVKTQEENLRLVEEIWKKS